MNSSSHSHEDTLTQALYYGNPNKGNSTTHDTGKQCLNCYTASIHEKQKSSCKLHKSDLSYL